MKVLYVLFALLLLVMGCKTTDMRELSTEEVRLKWVHQAQFAGNYVAEEKGFYDELGLDVALVPFSFEDPVLAAVANKEAKFGITGADELLIARSQGEPLVAVAVIYRTNPVAAYALEESGIAGPFDFTGKTVGIEKGVNVEYIYAAMMSKLGIDRSEIDEVYIGYDATELLNGTTDVSTGYIINEPHQVIEAGRNVTTILMADYGVNIYADVLFVHEDTLQEHPAHVQAFVTGTLRGWEYAFQQPEETVGIVLSYAPDRTYSHEYYMLKQSQPLISSGILPMGWMQKRDWRHAQDLLLAQHILGKPVDLDAAFDNRFVDAYYAGGHT